MLCPSECNFDLIFFSKLSKNLSNLSPFFYYLDTKPTNTHLPAIGEKGGRGVGCGVDHIGHACGWVCVPNIFTRTGHRAPQGTHTGRSKGWGVGAQEAQILLSHKSNSSARAGGFPGPSQHVVVRAREMKGANASLSLSQMPDFRSGVECL